MRKAYSLLCVLLAVLLLTLCGCSDYKPLKSKDEELEAVGYVGEREVLFDELKFVVHTYRQILTDTYGDGIFEGEDKDYYLELLRERVYANITADYALLSLCDEVGIGLGETAVLEAVNKRMSETVEELGGMGEYKKFLKENNVTDRMLRRSVEISLLESELMYVYIDDLGIISDSDEEIYEIIKNEFLVVRHIFIPHSQDNAHETLAVVKDKLDGGEDFAALLDEYGCDGDMTAEGNFILKGYMTKSYEKAAFELSVGECSDIVEDEHGYYIIERLKMNTAKIMLQMDYLKELYQTYTFYAMVDLRQEALTFVPNELCESYMENPFSK